MSNKEDFEKWWGGLPTEYKPNMTQDEKLNMWDPIAPHGGTGSRIQELVRKNAEAQRLAIGK